MIVRRTGEDGGSRRGGDAKCSWDMPLADRIDPLSKRWLKKRKKLGSDGGSGSGRGSPAAEPALRLLRLPPIKTAPLLDKEELISKKLEQCRVVFEFGEPDCGAEEEVDGRVVKTEALLELCEAVAVGTPPLAESLFPQLVATVAANIFRSLPPNDCQDLDLEEDDDPVLEPSWPHLSLVYDLLLRFLECPDLRLHAVQRVIDEKFVAKILELFDSEDVRERAVLKLVLHRIYSKFLPLRQFIRRRISDLFLGLAYEGGKLNGVGELLELVGSIVQGFSTPLKEEHKRTLLWVLMPLHKPPHLRAYHTHLTNCVVRFVEKDSALAVPVVASLLKFWPKTCSQKQVLFLNELEDIFDVTVPSVFELMVEPVFERLSSCFCSPQYQVLERSLALWSNEYFVYLVSRNVARVMPIVLPALFKAFKDHWNPSAGPMVCNVLEILMKADGHLFHQTAELRGHERPSSATQRERHHLWRKNELQVRRSNKKN